jgi:hypothetical protein
MFKKTILSSVLAACLMLTPMMVRGAGNDSTGNITVTVHVDTFAEWADSANTYSVTIPTITLSGQTRTGTRNLTLYSNVNVTLSATAGANSGILTSSVGTGSGTLDTTYSLGGTGITPTNPLNTGQLDTTTFFANTYDLAHVQGDGGSYTVTLTVEASSPTTGAPESDDYTCGLSLTATWL